MATSIQSQPRGAVVDWRGVAIDGSHLRAVAFHDVRAAYIRRVLQHRFGASLAEKQALVVKSGQGLVTTELARLGLRVTGLDPSAVAHRLAAAAAARDDLEIAYEVGDPLHLPIADDRFDIAYYADTFETTPDLDQVLAEAARVLRPGGVLVYDTVTRTFLTRIIYLGAFQSWRMTSIVPRGRYAWDRLRPPDEVAATMARHGLQSEDITPFRPASVLGLARAVLAAKRGSASETGLARLAGMRLEPSGKRPLVTYLGYGSKRQ